jgi:hypothetical protein
MITTIKIESQMNCEHICQKIHQAILKYQQNSPDMSDTLIVIDIKKVSADTDSLIPKLEFKTE